MSQIQTVPVTKVRVENLQIRCETSRAHIDDLSELFDEENPVWPDSLPPIVVFFDNFDYWLGDGHHRLYAAQQAGCPEVQADVRKGSKVDALYHALQANTEHGLKRTPSDRRNAILIAYHLDPELPGREIARMCRVSEGLVRHHVAEHKRERETVHCAICAVSETLSGKVSTAQIAQCDGMQPSQVSTASIPQRDGTTASDPHCVICAVEQTASAEAAPVIKRDKNGRRLNVANIGKSKPALNAEVAQPWQAAAVRMDEIVQQLRAIQKQVNELASMPGAELLRSSALACEKQGDAEHFRSRDMSNFTRELQWWKPHASCPACKLTVRNGCDVCKDLGWITAEQQERLPARLKV